MNSLSNNSIDATENIAIQVLKEYPVSPLGITLIQGGTIKTVWQVRTNSKNFCLKRLNQTLDKATFSSNAQIHIKKAGGNVPGIIPNKAGQPITAYREQLFILYDWVDGTDINFNNPTDLKTSIQGLADFHVHSKGYIPADNSRISTKLGRWPEQYDSMLTKLASWNETALKSSNISHYAAYSKYTSSIIAIGKLALASINESKYNTLTADNSNSIVLCHQDYGKGNAILTDRGVCVLDLDGVTFDLPARDLRKIIGKIAENKNQWQIETIEKIIGWYGAVNPLSPDERKILYIDLLFPHWYYGLVKNMFQNGKAVKAEQIERIAHLEISKVPVLNFKIPT